MSPLLSVLSKRFAIFAPIERIVSFKHKKQKTMKSLGYLGAFFGGAIAGAVIGLLLAPEKGTDTRDKITDAVDDFMKKHNIKLTRKEVSDLVDDIEEAAPEA